MTTGLSAPVGGDTNLTADLSLLEHDASGLADMMAGGPLPQFEAEDRLQALDNNEATFSLRSGVRTTYPGQVEKR